MYRTSTTLQMSVSYRYISLIFIAVALSSLIRSSICSLTVAGKFGDIDSLDIGTVACALFDLRAI
ncbi:hypothetical protein DM01DRAFT_306558 [Hesseltinella vesiculosa]|uniref:Uncharacterized protein n=1 Tax=Hesseltinella vesiculosa TaxID=101127 RepID=A0A1X2GNC6_9FUNG|nr:hypothetical protein DM01DRAFT_306558 [Hesseltinella vesiculosa]